MGHESSVRAHRVLLSACAILVVCLAFQTAQGQPQALCVPFRGVADMPHFTYSGATITLQGAARGANIAQFRWEYGDGGGTSWTPIADPYNLGVRHAYTGPVGSVFPATLHVRDTANVEATCTYPVRIYQSSDLRDPLQLDVRIYMAIDAALWYLHTTVHRPTFGAGAPGYGQPYGYWDDVTYGYYTVASTGAAVNAFEVNGHLLNGDTSDPYVETVQRGMNFLLVNTHAFPIGQQLAGNPDTFIAGEGTANGQGLACQQSGSVTDSAQTYVGGICMSALSESRTPEYQAPVGGAFVYQRPLKYIVQDMADFFAWAQCDSGQWRGGWRYYANQGDADMSTTQWPPLGMGLAEPGGASGMAITVPPFVRTELPTFLTNIQRMELDNDNGGFGYRGDDDEYVNDTKAGAGLICLQFEGIPPTDPRFQKAMGFLYRHWNDNGGNWAYAKLFGNSYGMFAVSKAFRIANPPITRITEYDYINGHPTANSFDWFYTPPDQPPGFTGMGSYIVSTQAADGHWDDNVGPNAVYGPLSTAWRIIALGSPKLPPVPAICDCDRMSNPLQGFNLNEDIPLDGSCSSHPDPNVSIARYDWYLCDPTLPDCTGEIHLEGAAVTLAGGYSSSGIYPAKLYVTDADGVIGGPYTCQLNVHPPPHCPYAAAYPSLDPATKYLGWLDQPVTLDGSRSWDPNGDPLTYQWELNWDDPAQDPKFDDATGVSPTWTWHQEGTFRIALKVTDNPAAGFDPCSDVSFTTIEVGNHAPVAEPGGPYETAPGNCITLDASGSYDPDPTDTISFAWDFGCVGQYDDSTDVAPQFCVPADAPFGSVYCASLKVTDNHGKYSTKSTTITVSARPPVARCKDVTVPAGADVCAASASIDDGSYDPAGGAVQLAQTPPGPYALGPTPVTLVVTGTSSLTASCRGTVTVVDQTPPSLTCPPDATAECTGHCGVLSSDPQLASFFAGAVATDVCYAGPTISNNAPPLLPVGSIPITFTAQDVPGNTSSCIAHVNVTDMVGPTVAILQPPPRVLLPTFPLALAFSSGDVCGVVHEVLKIQGCAVYDGFTFGDLDGLLSDESIQVSQAEMCRIAQECGFTVLTAPELRVEVTDCGGNVTTAARTLFQGSLKLRPGICGP